MPAMGKPRGADAILRCALMVLLCCGPGSAGADLRVPADTPADVPTVSVEFPDEIDPAPPEAVELDWNLIADLQSDFMVATQIDEDDRDSINLRRARFSAILDWGFDLRLRLSGDLGKYSGLRDLSIEYRGLPVALAVGRMIEPFGLLQGSSSGAALMERAQALVLGPGYGVGIAGSMAGRGWSATAGAFDATQNDLELGGRKENALTGRVTLAPWQSEASILHVGGAVSRRDSDEGFLRWDAIPESTLVSGLNAQSSSDFYANPGSPGSNRYWLYGGELAWRQGPVLLQSEYLWVTFDHVNTRAPSGELVRIRAPVFRGYYLEASWAITGEKRDYSVRRGMFGNVYPQSPIGFGGIGAVEVAARISHTDLVGYNPYYPPDGDRSTIGSLGLNWYPDDRFKLMLEGLQIERERYRSAGYSERCEWLVQARLQWYFLLP